MKLLKHKISKLILLLMVFSCVESIEVETIDFDNYLVIEAGITNELKKHTIKLSRTFEIDNTSQNTETNANVSITTSSGTTYQFNEVSSGVYESIIAFSAIKDENYSLKIITSNGESYSSAPQQLTEPAQIEKITTAIESSTEGFEGVSIYVHSNNPNNNSNYYRFTYEETYKISPPFWSDEELRIVSDSRPFRVEVIDRTANNKDCYKTLNSTEILIAETKSLAKDEVIFPVKFMLDNDFKIAERYSILVKQFVQTPEAYNYFSTLKKLSSSDNVFAQSQPGFIAGNITSDSSPNENVIGFFQVSAVTEKRLFFNFDEIFPDKDFDYPYDCEFAAPILFDSFTQESPLVDLIKSNNYSYYQVNDTGLPQFEGPYLMVPKVCGDCTVLGTNVKPTFWVD